MKFGVKHLLVMTFVASMFAVIVERHLAIGRLQAQYADLSLSIANANSFNQHINDEQRRMGGLINNLTKFVNNTTIDCGFQFETETMFVDLRVKIMIPAEGFYPIPPRPIRQHPNPFIQPVQVSP